MILPGCPDVQRLLMNSPIPPKHIAALIILIVTGVLAICATRYFEHINSDLQRAEAAIDAKKYRQARQILEPLAKNRNPKAARMLGELYDFGHGGPQNLYTSRKLYEISAAGGDADGMSHLASLIGQGLGGYDDEKIAEQLSIKAAWLGSVEANYVQGMVHLWGYRTKQDYAKAFKYFNDGAKKQHGPSELLLAHMYAHGLGIEKDEVKSVSLTKSAQFHNCKMGEFAIGELYAEGKTVPKNFQTAFEYYSKAADKGHPKACYRLALLYLEGKGVEKNIDKALHWFATADLNGAAFADYSLAEAYRTGEFIPKNLEQAKLLHEASAKIGIVDSAHWLAFIYETQDAPDFVEARKWSEIAVAGNRRGAMADLASFLEEGKGGPKDVKRAAILYERAAMLQSPNALYKMGMRFLEGNGTPRNYTRALRFLQASAKKGEGIAECFLAAMYESGLGVPVDQEKALELVKSSKQHGCDDPEYRLGRYYYEGSVLPKDYAKAKYWLSKGAELGNPHAMNYFGMLYYHGCGVEKDEAKAVSWFKKGMEKGCPGATSNMAGRYQTGHGVERDLKKSKMLYEMLVKDGISGAADDLKKVTAELNAK